LSRTSSSFYSGYFGDGGLMNYLPRLASASQVARITVMSHGRPWDCLIITHTSPPTRSSSSYLNLKQMPIQGMWVDMHAFPPLWLPMLHNKLSSALHQYLSLYLVCWGKWPDPNCETQEF
jgi:hypothetical protein